MAKTRKLVVRNHDFIEYKKNRNSELMDYLTGLRNRRALYKFYQELASDTTIHVMFIDIDNFKRVNDTYGHSEGDKLLKCVAQLLQNTLSRSDFFRIGGDEFVGVISGRFREEELIEKVNLLLSSMQQVDFRKDVLSLISLSIGIVFSQNVNQVLDEVLNKCDSAMYRAKNSGKNQYVIYSSVEQQEESNRNIEAEMEEALRNRQFEVFFQPKVNMLTSHMVGTEALARWDHPTDGMRQPTQFIPLFEKNGFITKLDYYIFEEVCRLKKKWAGSGVEHVRTSVNMSRLHLYQKNFPEDLKGICEKYGVATSEMEIEILESTFVKDSMELIVMVKKLQDYGFYVSIDDFGSGYSALNMLKDIPVETIKLDKEFLQLSSGHHRGRKVIKNIIIMCKELKLDIVAEGVETKKQRDFLASCGCEVAQGFYFSEPLSEEAFVKYAKEYLSIKVKPVVFSFDGSLDSDDGLHHGEYIPDPKNPQGYEYTQGVMTGKKALRLTGGELLKGCVSLPPDIMLGESFTISFWLNVTKPNAWSSVLFMEYDTGFVSYVPNAWEGHGAFRMRDAKDVNGWYDTAGCQLASNGWFYITVSYNARTESTFLMVNNMIIATREEVPTQRFLRRVLIGGDIYQRSLEMEICELRFYREMKSPEEICAILREDYEENPDFWLAHPQEEQA